MGLLHKAPVTKAADHKKLVLEIPFATSHSVRWDFTRKEYYLQTFKFSNITDLAIYIFSCIHQHYWFPVSLLKSSQLFLTWSQIITDIISGHFSYRTDLDHTL